MWSKFFLFLKNWKLDGIKIATVTFFHKIYGKTVSFIKLLKVATS